MTTPHDAAPPAGSAGSRAAAQPVIEPAGLVRSRFRVMGTGAEIIVRAPADVAIPHLLAAQTELWRINDLCTRFDPGSPIEQLNDRGGGRVDEELWEILALAQRALRETEGRVDVCVGADVIAAGYDRDFDLLDIATNEEMASRTPPRLDDAVRALREFHCGYRTVTHRTIRIDPGVRIDLGGIAKGWAADLLRRRLAPIGSCLVNLGGDISLHVADDEDPWPVGIDYPDGTRSFAVAHGGLATSGQDRRVWRVPGREGLAHHVIDPRTHRPAKTDILRITVFGKRCIDAEIWAKALFLQGMRRALDEVDRRELTTVIVGMDGSVVCTGLLGTQSCCYDPV